MPLRPQEALEHAHEVFFLANLRLEAKKTEKHYEKIVLKNVPSGYQQAYDPEIGTVHVVSVSGPKMYGISKGNYAKRVAENTQLYQVIYINDKNLEYKAYEATGKLYDKFTLEKRNGLPNLLIEALPAEKRK